MSTTIDTNVLVYASDQGSRRRPRARELLETLAAGPNLLYLFWPTIAGYLRIVTHAGILSAPLAPDEAASNVRGLIERSHVRMPGEQDGFWSDLEQVLEADTVRGNLVPDAHLVALMRQNGVRTIWTADRDFRRFPGIDARDPYT